MLHRNYALATVALASFVLAMTDAEASAQRTFVASYGNDANVCSLTQPCRGFAAAPGVAGRGLAAVCDGRLLPGA